MREKTLTLFNGVWKWNKKSHSTFWVEKSSLKMPKNRSILTSFWKPEVCSQTVLPDSSISIEQKLIENAKIQKFK